MERFALGRGRNELLDDRRYVLGRYLSQVSLAKAGHEVAVYEPLHFVDGLGSVFSLVSGHEEGECLLKCHTGRFTGKSKRLSRDDLSRTLTRCREAYRGPAAEVLASALFAMHQGECPDAGRRYAHREA